MMQDSPLVSIVLVSKNRVETVRRALDSILNQTYKNIEVVVQDAESTDGTQEILRSYGDRIKLIVEPDQNSVDGMNRALRRCQGVIIGSCLTDEELFSYTVQEAVDHFTANPEVVAICRDFFISNLKGDVVSAPVFGREFGLLDYITCIFNPCLATAFFRRSRLEEVGLKSRVWRVDCCEFELWTRAIRDSRVDYLPGASVKYAISQEGQVSLNPNTLFHTGISRSQLTHELFEKENLFDQDPHLKAYIFENIGKNYECHLLPKYPDKFSQLNETIKQYLPTHLPPLGLDYCRQLVKFRKSLLALKHCRKLLNEGSTNPEIYLLMTNIFMSFGLIDEATESINNADRLGVKHFWLLAAHLLFLDPRLTPKVCMAKFRSLAEPHLANVSVNQTPALHRSGENIRLGIHVYDWDDEEFQCILLPILERLKKRNFDVSYYLGHSRSTPDDHPQSDMHITSGLTDSEFVRLVRSHQIDIFLDASGIRLGARLEAMSVRCAKIQISHLKHYGALTFPFIDYLVSDSYSAPYVTLDSGQTRVFEMPQCQFCFDPAKLPHVSSDFLSFTKKKFITFGCFEEGPSISQLMLGLWAKILVAFPQSRLILSNYSLRDVDARLLIRKSLQSLGVSPLQLLLLPRTKQTHLGDLLGQIDIYLDTYPCNGSVNLAAALINGIPVITLNREKYSSSIGASILQCAGYPQNIACTFADYIKKSVELAQKASEIQKNRLSMRQSIQDCGLTRIDEFCCHYERGLRSMHESGAPGQTHLNSIKGA